MLESSYSDNGTDYKIAGTCVSVCHRSCGRILNQIWWNFAQLFGAGKLRSSSLVVKIWQCLLYPQFSQIFTNSYVFSMGRYKHCSINTDDISIDCSTDDIGSWYLTRCPSVATSGALLRKWHNPNVTPKYMCSAFTAGNGICLYNIWRITSQYQCKIGFSYNGPPICFFCGRHH